MKVIIVALALVAVAAAAPAVEERLVLNPAAAKILRSLFESQPNGGYVWGFDAENGIQRDETGELIEVLDEQKNLHPVVIVRGSWSYFNDKGELETMNYTADQDGFHPDGPSIPKPVSPVASR